MRQSFQEDLVAYLIGDKLLCRSCALEGGDDHAIEIVINPLYVFPPVCDDCGELLGDPGDLADVICDRPRYGFRDFL